MAMEMEMEMEMAIAMAMDPGINVSMIVSVKGGIL